jgi:glycogen operon protein
MRRAATALLGLLVACGATSADEHGPTYSPDAATPMDDAGVAMPDASVEAGTFPSGLGAWYDSAHSAIVFRVYSKRATRVEVYLYAKALGETERAHVALAVDATSHIWSATITTDALAQAGIGGDVYYGYRAWGPNFTWDASWTPGSSAGFVSDVDADGNRFNPNKLVYDPYARELSHDPATPGSTDGSVYATGATTRATDSALAAPKGIVLGPDAAGIGTKPTRAFKDDVVYEVNVRGFTMSDPSVPLDARGTYRGAAMKAAYLADVGVTAIEFQPVHETQNDTNDLAAASMSTNGMNYWGYSTLAYFSPDRRYSSDKSAGGPTREFRAMVKAMHDAGIKVMLDVVYNHTGEGGVSAAKPTVARLLSWRGLDNATYYELSADNQTSFDATGTSGDFNTADPAARDLILDSLRYWKDAMGVDGFRFDLAPVLGNSCARACFQYDKGDKANALNRAVAELPARPSAGGDGVDLVAEPWAIGAGTFQLGKFPVGWSEWNGNFRDTVRRTQNKLGVDAITPSEIATRMGGSSDLFAAAGRLPSAAVNYVASHDGFTLRDIYAYQTKENTQAWPFGPSPGGDDNNDSWDQGGDATAQRAAARTAISLAMLSAGVPMITGGDEMYRTQYGNNNPYNLDSDKNWLDWSNVTSEAAFVSFARRLIRFRNAHAALRPAAYRTGQDHDHNGLKDVTLLRSNGSEADATYLGDATQHFIALRIDGAEGGDTATSIYIAYNAWSAAVVATPPSTTHTWYVAGDSSSALFADVGQETALGAATYAVAARSVVVLVER